MRLQKVVHGFSRWHLFVVVVAALSSLFDKRIAGIESSSTGKIY
jgi:hypothetical protein